MSPSNPETASTLRIAHVQKTESKGRARLRLVGHLDADGAPALSEELQRLLEAGVNEVDVDLAGVPFVSSMGIGCIIAAVGDFQTAGGELALTGLSSELRQLLEMLDLLDYVKIR